MSVGAPLFLPPMIRCAPLAAKRLRKFSHKPTAAFILADERCAGMRGNVMMEVSAFGSVDCSLMRSLMSGATPL